MADGPQRLDKWLYFGRLARSRTLAQEIIRAGKVRVNRNKVRDPAQPVRIGDTLTIALAGQVRVCRIEGFAERRGPYREARNLYCDLAAEKVMAGGGEPGPPDSPASRE
jgi:ribosome-associated heat shock protein Hsp15